MKPQPHLSTQEVLAGLVERVTFHNTENGFCVLRAKARGHRDLVTVIGHAATIVAGEWITASGEWVNDRTHGQQFKARFLKTSEPTSIDGIEKYLGSGMIRGIGPVYAKKLVRAFGEKVFDTIEAEPERLREVTGIGPVRARKLLSLQVLNGLSERARCLSACTLVLSTIPRNRVCVVSGLSRTSNHRSIGRRSHFREATRAVVASYPAPVRSWIKRHGGLTNNVVLLRGRKLAALYPRCRR
jgi:ATP-dependent exoDNAse (exonuclease V) alpha subunit